MYICKVINNEKHRIMKKVRYNDLQNERMHWFKDGETFEVLKETKKQLVILSKDGREHTLHKRCLYFFTVID